MIIKTGEVHGIVPGMTYRIEFDLWFPASQKNRQKSRLQTNEELEEMSEKELDAYVDTLEQEIKNAWEKYNTLQKAYRRLTRQDFQWFK